eukprot:6117869-Alexandrium_andersonii.AAC.1
MPEQLAAPPPGSMVVVSPDPGVVQRPALAVIPPTTPGRGGCPSLEGTLWGQPSGQVEHPADSGPKVGSDDDPGVGSRA